MYYGKENPIAPPIANSPSIVMQAPCGEAKLAQNIVIRLFGLLDVGHFVTMDNFFFNTGLFKKLLA